MKHKLKTALTVWLSIAGAGGASLFLANNNLSWRHSRQTFADSFDRAIRLGTDWMVIRREGENPALLYMIADMADLSGDVRLRRIVASFLTNPSLPRYSVSRRMVDPHAVVQGPTREELSALQDYQRWFAYAIAPESSS